VAPNVTAAANQSGDEGTEKSFDLGSFSDPGAESSWSVDVNWGDSTAHTTFTKSSAGSLGSKPHTYVDNGTYTVTVKVSDDAGNGSATFTITIGNLAPNVLTFTGNDYLYGPLSFLSGSPVTGTFSGTFRDLGIKDNPWIVSYAWDGTNDPATQSVDYNGTTDHNFGPKTHTFTAGCNHSAKATVTDKDGASGFKTTTINVGTGSFMPPMTNQPVTDKLKNGQVLPVKVQLADCAGVSLAGLSPVIELRAGDLTSTPEVGTDTIPVQSVSAADSGNIMRAADGFYIYNLRINVPTLNTPYTIIIYPYGTSNPATLRHVIQATK